MKFMTLKQFLTRVACCAALIIAGCQTTRQMVRTSEAEREAFTADFSPALKDAFLPALTEGPQNEVMHYMNAGTTAFYMGEWTSARIAFDRALLKIESFFADNEIAEQARSNFTPEDFKDFRGEPYERMMAYYYRGLIYLKDGDYENARASFRGGLLQDSLTYEEDYAQDSALLAYLVGWASQCNGDLDLAAESYAEAGKYNEALKAPNPEDTVLFLSELGFGPVKQATGKYNEAMVIVENRSSRERFAIFSQNDRAVMTQLAEDLFFQANTRGGRAIDAILAGKAQFKNDTGIAGQAMQDIGNELMTDANSDQYTAALGIAFALTGVVMSGISAATIPEADVRMWRNLPSVVHLATAPASGFDFKKPMDVMFFDRRGKVVNELFSPVRVGGTGQCRVVWASSRPRDYEDINAPLF